MAETIRLMEEKKNYNSKIALFDSDAKNTFEMTCISHFNIFCWVRQSVVFVYVPVHKQTSSQSKLCILYE